MSTELGIITGEIYPMPGGYEFESFRFTGTLEGVLDGGFYRLPPNTATRVVEIRGPVSAWENPIKGNGRFIISSEEGEVRYFDFDSDSEVSPPAIYGFGDTVVWIGGTKGAEILSFTRPPFKDDVEAAVETDSPEVPQKFWELYHEIVTSK